MSKRKVQGKLDNFFGKRQALEAVADEQTAADDWLLKININKCKVLTVGRDVDKNNTYSIIENNKPVIPYNIVASVRILVF